MLQFLLFSLAAALLYHSAPVSALSICYGNLGCFTDDPPYTNTLGVLPGSPAEVGTRFFLYTRASPYPEQLDYNFPANVNRSSFDPELPTKVIIHGYQNNLQTVWLSRMKDAFLATDEYNVILVGWGPGATTIVYPQSVSNTRIVARQLARLLLVLWQTKGLDLNSVHLIGFSLGAHLAGYVSRELGYKVGRITGLDPAGPLFQSFGEPIYLDRNDAIFVDIIHSNGLPGGAGTFISHGHVDFFSNGGAHQPGCEAREDLINTERVKRPCSQNKVEFCVPLFL
ncbi:hypothetical protein RRG08_006023 [Elysia crispata]|uniref:Lipase domain-containing protein n=1 Tax=Elysia crispata TaxID=231223 RepID=A0AAE1DMB4_9GAST|nr:hypothetical protein RRG08_006023 [Elysia crispata]